MAMNFRSFVLLSGLALACPPLAMAQETPQAVVAAAVRDAGHECKKPGTVKPDPKRSSADEKAWIIQCERGSYRVKFMGDRGAKVEPVAAK